MQNEGARAARLTWWWRRSQSRPDDGVRGHGWAAAGLVSDQSREEEELAALCSILPGLYAPRLYRVGNSETADRPSVRKSNLEDHHFRDGSYCDRRIKIEMSSLLLFFFLEYTCVINIHYIIINY